MSIPGVETSPPRVLFLNRDLEFHGGVANVLLTLAGASSTSDVAIASMMTPSREMVAAFEGNASVDCIGDSVPSAVWRLRRLIRTESLDVIVPCSFRAMVVAFLATVGLDVTVVPYLHSTDGIIEGRVRRRLFGAMTRRSPMMFVSEAVMRAQRPRGHTAPIAVVHNGVRDHFADPAALPYGREVVRDEFGIPDDALLLGYLAAFVPVKDHDTLLAAYARLDPSLDAHLILIGKVEAGSQIEKQVAALDTDRVRLVQPRADARRILGGLDIYVHTSRNEGFGLAIVEAMLAGRPVVAVRGGAVPEYIEDGRNGMLAEPGDAASVAAAIEQLARDRELAERIAAEGQRDARERFGAERFATRVMDFLTEVSRR